MTFFFSISISWVSPPHWVLVTLHMWPSKRQIQEKSRNLDFLGDCSSEITLKVRSGQKFCQFQVFINKSGSKSCFLLYLKKNLLECNTLNQQKAICTIDLTNCSTNNIFYSFLKFQTILLQQIALSLGLTLFTTHWKFILKKLENIHS